MSDQWQNDGARSDTGSGPTSSSTVTKGPGMTTAVVLDLRENNLAYIDENIEALKVKHPEKFIVVVDAQVVVAFATRAEADRYVQRSLAEDKLDQAVVWPITSKLQAYFL